jgi:type IV pilus assembly protein PilO
MMKIEFPTQKKIIIAGLVILIAADAILALYAIESATRFSRNELAGQKTQIKLLKADIKRALAIQRSIPQTKADCERFENSLYASSAGYSAVTDEMTGFAKQAGLQVVSLAFHPKELPGRNVVELGLDATVNGDYKGVVRFLNGLQRSKNFYIIDTLTVAAEPTAQAGAGALRVALSLRSYFKNAA